MKTSHQIIYETSIFEMQLHDLFLLNKNKYVKMYESFFDNMKKNLIDMKLKIRKNYKVVEDFVIKHDNLIDAAIKDNKKITINNKTMHYINIKESIPAGVKSIIDYSKLILNEKNLHSNIVNEKFKDTYDNFLILSCGNVENAYTPMDKENAFTSKDIAEMKKIILDKNAIVDVVIDKAIKQVELNINMSMEKAKKINSEEVNVYIEKYTTMFDYTAKYMNAMSIIYNNAIINYARIINQYIHS